MVICIVSRRPFLRQTPWSCSACPLLLPSFALRLQPKIPIGSGLYPPSFLLLQHAFPVCFTKRHWPPFFYPAAYKRFTVRAEAGSSGTPCKGKTGSTKPINPTPRSRHRSVVARPFEGAADEQSRSTLRALRGPGRSAFQKLNSVVILLYSADWGSTRLTRN